MRKLRLLLLGTLCAGLLLCGIGFGVGFEEFSSFTYGGEMILGNSHEVQTDQSILSIYPTSYDTVENAPEYHYQAIVIDRYFCGGRLETPPTLRVSELVDPHTIQIDTQYVGSNAFLNLSQDTSFSENSINRFHIYGYLHPHDNGMGTLMTAAKQLKEDVKNRTFHDYTPNRVLNVTLTVNPAEADHIYYGSQHLSPEA